MMVTKRKSYLILHQPLTTFLLSIEDPSQFQNVAPEDADNAVLPENGNETFQLQGTVGMQKQQSNNTVPESSKNILREAQYSTYAGKLIGKRNAMNTILAWQSSINNSAFFAHKAN